MKDIGSQFEEKRREIGIKLEEAASDLEITVAQLENLEDGNVNAFKDIFFLKELIKKYGSVKKIKEASIQELSQIIPENVAINLKEYLESRDSDGASKK